MRGRGRRDADRAGLRCVVGHDDRAVDLLRLVFEHERPKHRHGRRGHDDAARPYNVPITGSCARLRVTLMIRRVSTITFAKIDRRLRRRKIRFAPPSRHVVARSGQPVTLDGGHADRAPRRLSRGIADAIGDHVVAAAGVGCRRTCFVARPSAGTPYVWVLRAATPCSSSMAEFRRGSAALPSKAVTQAPLRR